MPCLWLKNNEIDNFQVYNLTIKKYSDNLVKYKRTSFDNFKGFFHDNTHTGTLSIEELESKSKQYLKKVKTNIIDLGYNNRDKFDYFVTFTFNDKEIGEEYSHDKAIKCLIKWLDKVRHQNNKMYYILVPEFHKSGRLHFHGLVGNVENWELVGAFYPDNYEKIHLRGKPIYKNGCRIYNIKGFDYGFTTISKIKDKEKVTNYISKYATKELITLKSKKRYWYSRNLEKPKIVLDYIDSDLITHLAKHDIIYHDVFKTENREIELCNIQLPIIDIMLTSVYKCFVLCFPYAALYYLYVFYDICNILLITYLHFYLI